MQNNNLQGNKKVLNTFQRDATLCFNCGTVLKANDTFCSSCGQKMTPKNILSGKILNYYRDLFIVSFFTSIVWALQVPSSNFVGFDIIRFGYPVLIINFLFDIILFALIIWGLYKYIKHAGYVFPKALVKNFLIYEFFIACLGIGLGLLIPDFLTSIQMSISGFVSLISNIIVYGIFIAFLFSFLLLIQNSFTDLYKNLDDSSTEVLVVGLFVCLITIFLNYGINFFVTSLMLNNFSSQLSTNPNELLPLTYISTSIASVIVLILIIVFSYFLIKKFSVYTNDKHIKRDLQLIFVCNSFLLFIGFVIVNPQLFPSLGIFEIVYFFLVELYSSIVITITYFALIYLLQPKSYAL